MDANPVVANAMSKRAKKKDTSGPGIDELESKSDSHQTESRNGMDNGTAQESFYVKDLQKNIRSINKKLVRLNLYQENGHITLTIGLDSYAQAGLCDSRESEHVLG